MFRSSLGLLFLVVLSAVSSVHADAPLEGTKPAHWRVIWTSDPAHNAIISWSTVKPATKYVIRYRTRNMNQVESTVTAERGQFTANGTAELYFYHVRLTELLPSTAYEFQIDSDGDLSPTLYFVTAPDDERGFRVLHGGDSRSDRDNRRRVNQMVASLVARSYANESLKDDVIAISHGGDYVASGSNLKQWIDWMSDFELTMCPDGRLTPIIPTRGNHDKGEIFNQVFGFPGGDLNYYAINLGPLVRLIVLNTETSTAGDQADWLEAELKTSRPENCWLIAQYHRPAYPSVKSPGSALQSWVPIFEKYNLDLVCESDGHTIKRTVPIRDNVRDDTGIVYIGEGGFGVAQRTPKSDRWYLQPPGMSSSASHVFELTLAREILTCQCVQLDGKIADQFTLEPRDVGRVESFIVSGDPQYLAENVPEPQKLDPVSDQANARFVDLLKSFPGTTIPQQLGGGKVNTRIQGIIVAGDLVDSADKTGGNYPAMQKFEWQRYTSDYGLTGKDRGLPFPVYELHGNHDGPQGDTFIIGELVARNKRRPGLVNISRNGLHYSWNWGPLHLVNLGMFVGDGDRRRDQYHYAPLGSLEFLLEDLAKEIGESGRPVALAFHLHPNGPAFDWPPQDLELFWNAIQQYNVVALFHGHTHGSPPSRITWNENGFGPDLEQGIDVFNPDDSGAGKINPQDPANPLGIRHGFLYVELIDRPGTAADQFVVRSVLTNDNWRTHQWGQEWKKNIGIPGIE